VLSSLTSHAPLGQFYLKTIVTCPRRETEPADLPSHSAPSSAPAGPFFAKRKQMNDDVAWGTAIATEILANEPGNPCAVRVFDIAGNNIVTLTRKAASESEILGEPIDVHLDPGRDAKVEAFFYHLVQARALMREIRFARYGLDSETKVGIFFNRLANVKNLMRDSRRFGPSFFCWPNGSSQIGARTRSIKLPRARVHVWREFIVRADEKLTAFMELERTIYQFAVRSIS
jgi:hypothetical protein